MKKLISIILTLSLSLSTLCCVNCFAANETTCDTDTKTISTEIAGSTTSDTINNIYGDTHKKSSTFKKFLIDAFAVVLTGTAAACIAFKFDFLSKTICTHPIDEISTKTEVCQYMINGKTIPLELGDALRYTCSYSHGQVNRFEEILKQNKNVIEDLMSTPESVKIFFKACVLKYSECKCVSLDYYGNCYESNNNMKNFDKAFNNVFGI